MSTLDSAEWRTIKDRVPEDSEAKPQGPGVLKKHRLKHGDSWRISRRFLGISGDSWILHDVIWLSKSSITSSFFEHVRHVFWEIDWTGNLIHPPLLSFIMFYYTTSLDSIPKLQFGWHRHEFTGIIPYLGQGRNLRSSVNSSAAKTPVDRRCWWLLRGERWWLLRGERRSPAKETFVAEVLEALWQVRNATVVAKSCTSW